MACATEELNIKIYLILINMKIIAHMSLTATMLDTQL